MYRQIPFVALSLVMVTVVLPAVAQSTAFTPSAAAAATVVPTLVRYTGDALRGDGKAQTGDTSITFLIFKEERGGEPLWVETQTVAIDPTGHYSVYLGAMNTSGLAAELFGTGEARWLEVQVVGEKVPARVLLTSVPYALKAADAATLGGLPASAFVLAGSQVAFAATSATPARVTPEGSSTVTTTGGTSKYLPLFTGTSTIANSEIYDTGTSVGIGDVPSASAKLDVNGPIIMRGGMIVTRSGNATSSKAYPSYGFDFYSNAYNSSTKATDNPHFQLQSEPTGNNTSNTGATFNLLYSNHGSTPAETGLSINPSGVVHFASGQSFSSTSSNGTALYGQSTSADGVDGISTSGDGVKGFSASAEGVQGTSNMANGVDGITYGKTLNTAGVLGVAGSGNTSGYGGIAGVWGDAAAHVGVLGTSDQYNGVQGLSSASSGVYGVAGSGNMSGYTGIAGVWGDADVAAGLYGTSDNGEGVLGKSAANTGILGISLGTSDTFSTYQNYGYVAGTWGDTSKNTDTSPSSGIIGTADDNNASYFANNSDFSSTIYATNAGNGGEGLFKTIEAVTPQGTCGFGGKGDLTCTGQVKTLATTGASGRTVETYSVQSAENWFEDAGTVQLVKGTAHVDLEARFGQTVNTGIDYHVFLTPDGDCKGLYVSAKSAGGFDVHELGGGTSSIAFEYRIMAKRVGHEEERLVDVTEQMEKVISRRAKLNVAAKKNSLPASAKLAGMRRLTSPR